MRWDSPLLSTPQDSCVDLLANPCNINYHRGKELTEGSELDWELESCLVTSLKIDVGFLEALFRQTLELIISI